MKIRRTIGLPDIVTGSNPFLPDTGDGTAGGANGGAGAAPAAPTPTAAPPVVTVPVIGPNGFAEGTPLAELPIEQREAYWKHHARKHEDASKAKDARLAELEPIGEQFRALSEASKTDVERQIETARTEAAAAARETALAEARTTYGTQLVQVRLAAVLDGKGLTADQMAALAGDGSRFIGAAGVDGAALDAFLAALPDKAAAPLAPISLGAGRTAPVTAGGLQGGADLYADRHKKRTTT